MIIPIRCFTCSKVIADKFDYYQQEKEKISAIDNKGDNDLKFFNDIFRMKLIKFL